MREEHREPASIGTGDCYAGTELLWDGQLPLWPAVLESYSFQGVTGILRRGYDLHLNQGESNTEPSGMAYIYLLSAGC